jgi:hypothetical protein
MNRWPALAALLGSVALTLVVGCGGSTTAPVSPFSSSRIKPQNVTVPPPNEINNNTNSLGGGTSGPSTLATPSAYVLTFRGNLSKDISTADLPFQFNPFCPRSDSNGCPIVVTYEASTNTTTAAYSGPFDPNTPYQVQFHVGAIMAGTKSYGASAELMYGSQKPVPSYFVSVNSAKLVKKAQTWAYAEVYIGASLKSGGKPVFQLWQEIGYVPGGKDQPKFTFKNYGTQTLYVDSTGIVLNQPVPTEKACKKLTPLCKEDYAILALLNFAGSPPPGYSGSKFVPLQYPPPKVLKPEKL